jgi:hypothetical protein
MNILLSDYFTNPVCEFFVNAEQQFCLRITEADGNSDTTFYYRRELPLHNFTSEMIERYENRFSNAKTVELSDWLITHL